jgi:hypothetical protein
MSFFSRVITGPRPVWLTIVISLLLFLLPFGAALADGVWDAFLSQGAWRPFLMAPVVISYILIVSHWMAKSDSELLKAFRPLVLIEDEAFDRLARDASRIHPTGEVIALIFGALIGLGMSLPWLKSMGTSWFRIYVPVSLSMMWGILAWVIYYSMASTKLVTALHRQSLKVDILNTKPFEPMGRYSLIISLVFVGGIALGIIFGLDIRNIFAWQSWAINLPLLCVPVIIFFLNMRETHRLLATEKKRQLQVVAQKISLASKVMQTKIAEDESLGGIATEFTALVAYEARLRTASTWPYNTGMLRTLFFTLLLPLVVRGISALLFGN